MATGRYLSFLHAGLIQSKIDWAVTGATQQLDASTEMVAWKFWPTRTSSITHVDAHASVTGTSPSFTLEIQTDSADAPSGTTVGSATSAFSWTSTGFAGEQALGGAASVTVNTPYWLVCKYSSGTIDASNLIKLATTGTGWRPNQEKLRHHNGTNWTTTASVNAPGLIILKDASGYMGYPLTAALARSAQTDIFGTNRQGIQFTSDTRTKVQGVAFKITKTASPSDLVITVYEGNTSKYSETITAANISSGADHTWYFNSPVYLAADVVNTIVLSQTADGGNDSNDYDLQTWGIKNTYINALMPPECRFVAGTGNSPLSYSAVTTEIPYLIPLIDDINLDTSDTPSNGGTSVFIHCE